MKILCNLYCFVPCTGIRDEARLIETAHWTGVSSVIWHEYFGSRKVIQDLSRLNGWSDGHIKVCNCLYMSGYEWFDQTDSLCHSSHQVA